jgi:phosphopantetheinyl transferase
MLALALTRLSAPHTEGLIAAFCTEEDLIASRRLAVALRQRQRLTARALLRRLLTVETGIPARHWRLEHDAAGRPEARSHERAVAVSLAHSGDLAACAVSDAGQVGVDVEAYLRRRSVTAIAATMFGPAERRAVAEGGAPAFYRIWCVREALAKATGLGLAGLPREADFAAPTLERAWSAFLAGSEWGLASAGGEDFVGAVAMEPAGAAQEAADYLSAAVRDAA